MGTSNKVFFFIYDYDQNRIAGLSRQFKSTISNGSCGHYKASRSDLLEKRFAMQKIPFHGKEYRVSLNAQQYIPSQSEEFRVKSTTGQPVSSVGDVLRKMADTLAFAFDHKGDAHVFIAVLEGNLGMLWQMREFHDKWCNTTYLPMLMTTDSKAAQSILDCLSQVQ